MWKFYKFFTDRGIPGCQAGSRFLVINPDGSLIPCAMVWATYKSQRDMLKQFTAHNSCEMCYISTRANTEKTLIDYVADNWEMLARTVIRRKPQVVTGPQAEVPEPQPKVAGARSMAAR